MSSSFEAINYNLRPNKCIERKMMSVALSRLTFIADLDTYRYIGFGSPYFADFVLFHKNLGIKELISIEKEEKKRSRFDFNVPYSGIKMHYGESYTLIPNLELSKYRSIVWLDYDDQLSAYMFSDIKTFFLEAVPGSFFIVSVNVEPDKLPYLKNDEDDSNIEQDSLNAFGSKEKYSMAQKEFRLNKLIERLGKLRIPDEFMHLNLNSSNMRNVAYELIRRQIDDALLIRNGNNRDKVEFKQVFNFFYKDGASILTLGGILLDESQKDSVEKMAFTKLPFYSNGDKSIRINSPNLTFREIKALDRLLPSTLETIGGRFTNDELNKIPLNMADIKHYAEVYLYYPTFTDANI